MEDYTNLKFASLFHDIGKFYQRADNLGKSSHAYDSKYEKLDASDYGSTGAHSKWSADFVKDYFDDLVEELVLYHHNPSKSSYPELCKIVQKADHHSSKERIESDEKQEVLLTQLISIFSRVSLNDLTNEDYYVPLVELDFNKDLYPQNKTKMEGWNLVPEYHHLWVKFENEFKLLQNLNFESVLALVKKYTATIPSAVYSSQSDISLYDHLKTTTAIANCRYLYSLENDLNQSDNQNVYKIINGDISGIQNFIYKVNSPEDAQSGMSKRLKGRSIYLTLLCEAIAFKIINDLNLDSSNILFCGGGRFTIIAPNTSKADKIIKNIDLEVNKTFIDKFNAELYLALVSVNVDGNDLSNFGNVLSNISALLNENKKHKFINQLNYLFDKSDEPGYALCPVCGNLISDGEKFCSECQSHENLGSQVANAKYLIKYESNTELPNSLYFKNLGIGYIFKKYKNDVIQLVNQNSDFNFTISKLNDTDFLDTVNDITNDNVSFNFKVMGNNVPNIHGKPLYFNHLAEISKGANKLGVLKMDVDNLGKIFSKGFDNLKEDGGASISRISSLSFFMELFFSGYINQIIKKYKFFDENYGKEDLFDEYELKFENDVIKKVYRPKKELPKEEFENLGTSTIHINYSGGDDLLVVGPYDDIILFAEEFRNKFKDWTTQNDSVNISAGIKIISPKFPIGKAAIIADDELEKSKDCGRDKITVFGEILSWKSFDRFKGFDELLDFGQYLEDLKVKGLISSGFIYSLLKIWNSKSGVEPLSRFNKESWEDKNVEKVSKKRFIHIFKYKLKNIDDDDIREDLDKRGLKFMPWIKIPVSWASLRLR